MRPIRYTSLADIHARCLHEGDCLIWTGTLDRNGYGRVRSSGSNFSMHRLAWTLAHGDIAPGLDVHHHCNARACMNVEHMELLPHAIHGKLSAQGTRPRRAKKATHCPKGHDDWHVPPSGWRYCRICDRERAKVRYYAARQHDN